MKLIINKLVLGIYSLILLGSVQSAAVAGDLDINKNSYSLIDSTTVDPHKSKNEWLLFHENNIKPNSFYVKNLAKVDKEVYCLAMNNYYEAGGESFKGKIAVSEVVINRTQSGFYPTTPCGVVKQRIRSTCQFSWVCDRTIKQPEKNENSRGYKQWYESVVAALIVYREKFSGVAVGATHFYQHRMVSPVWARRGKMVKVAVVGNHTFMRPNN